jgi:hypothetical protein
MSSEQATVVVRTSLAAAKVEVIARLEEPGPHPDHAKGVPHA